MSTFVCGGNRQNPGNQNERPYQPQHPTHSSGDHCHEHGHVINKNNVEVLAREEGWFKRKIREAIEIKTLQPTINRDQGYDLPAIYSKILPVSVTRDCSRQTSGHPAQAIGAVASSSQTRRLRKLAFKSKKRLLKGNNFSTITMTESDNNIHAVSHQVVIKWKLL